MLGNDNFILVKRSKRKRRDIVNKLKRLECNSDLLNVDVEKVLRELEKARGLISTSEQFVYFINAIESCNTFLNVYKRTGMDLIEEIVSYGIGNFSKSHQALYQLAFLLELQSNYRVVVYVYDPVFSIIEKDILKTVGLKIIDKNEEGKRKVNLVTIFFLPHCPRELFNNLLWTNWGPSLSNCIIIGNKHSTIITNTPSSKLSDFRYVTKITPVIEEIDVPNVFQFQDVFNDLAVHAFPPNKLRKLSCDVWNFQESPIYKNTHYEFICNTNNLAHL